VPRADAGIKEPLLPLGGFVAVFRLLLAVAFINDGMQGTSVFHPVRHAILGNG